MSEVITIGALERVWLDLQRNATHADGMSSEPETEMGWAIAAVLLATIPAAILSDILGSRGLFIPLWLVSAALLWQIGDAL